MYDGVRVVGTIKYEAFDRRLDGEAWNAYTQFGEDGLINAVLEKIGTVTQFCFEVGAADGMFYSNTLRLREQGWGAVLIEAESQQFASLARYASDEVHCIHEEVRSLDETLSRCDAPNEVDLGIIDIDGQDYWLWHDMQKYRPRVMLVEFHWRDGEDFIPPRDPEDRRQAGRNALLSLGQSKGYVAVAQTHVNLLFVQEQLWGPIEA